MSELDSALSTVLILWFVVFGACIGSFVNVLVYRLPRRESLVHPPSHCPRCKHPIRWYDNLPVFGWIKLRGKCRDCQSPISIRYPCVEGFCAVLLGTVFVLLDQTGLSFWYLIISTLLFSFLGVSILALCLIAYDRAS
ncbi:MAG: prepilin peptidase [Planctomycetaceae bacterium]|jgi:leader peptidase (prepilin peptidase)/N-methyltransferase|nr:prepilin peptidase [Planctomycetaceae bacterium]